MNDECKDPQTQFDINHCASVAFGNADDEMNRVYQQALKNQTEVESGGGYYTGAVKALKKAQRSWIVYRDAHCDSYRIQFGGGTMWPAEVQGCKATLTKERTEQLHLIMEGTGR